MVRGDEIHQGGRTHYEPYRGLNSAGRLHDQFCVIGYPVKKGIMPALFAAAEQLPAQIGETEMHQLHLGKRLDKFPDGAGHKLASHRIGGTKVLPVGAQQMSHPIRGWIGAGEDSRMGPAECFPDHLMFLGARRQGEAQGVPGNHWHGTLLDGIGVFLVQPQLLPQNPLPIPLTAKFGEILVEKERFGGFRAPIGGIGQVQAPAPYAITRFVDKDVQRPSAITDRRDKTLIDSWHTARLGAFLQFIGSVKHSARDGRGDEQDFPVRLHHRFDDESVAIESFVGNRQSRVLRERRGEGKPSGASHHDQVFSSHVFRKAFTGRIHFHQHR